MPDDVTLVEGEALENEGWHSHEGRWYPPEEDEDMPEHKRRQRLERLLGRRLARKGA